MFNAEREMLRGMLRGVEAPDWVVESYLDEVNELSVGGEDPEEMLGEARPLPRTDFTAARAWRNRRVD
jgi:hypothetical protein